MKIRSENQPPAAAEAAAEKQAVAKQGEQRQAARTRKRAPAPRQQDSVELSAALDAELGKRQVEQEKRVAEIKARVAAGEYRVDSRAVAEKIASGRSKK